MQESHLGPGGSGPRARGLARIGRPLGTVGAVVLALIWAQARVPAMTERYIAEHTNNFAELKERIVDFSPDAMAPVCGVPAETIRDF